MERIYWNLQDDHRGLDLAARVLRDVGDPAVPVGVIAPLIGEAAIENRESAMKP